MNLFKIILFILFVFHTLSFFILVYEKLSNEEKIRWWSFLNIYIKEFLALLYIFFSWPFGFLGLESLVPRQKGGSKIPVFLIPGYFMTKASLYPIFWRLRNRKFENIFILDSFPFGGGVEDISLQIVKNIRQFTEILGVDQIVLVGFSVGGIVAKYIAMNQEQFNLKVKSFVCISSPHRGTKIAYFFPGVAMREVRPNSALLEKLGKMDREEISMYVGAKFDQFITDLRSLAPHSNCVVYDNYGHFSILFSKEVANKISEYIEKIEFYSSSKTDAVTENPQSTS